MGWPNRQNIDPDLAIYYYQYKEELSVNDGLVFKTDRIVLPTKLRQKILEILHTSHSGVQARNHTTGGKYDSKLS
jgi:hypothetical protein